MQPVRSPNPDPQEELGDILREATLELRTRGRDTPATGTGVKPLAGSEAPPVVGAGAAAVSPSPAAASPSPAAAIRYPMEERWREDREPMPERPRLELTSRAVVALSLGAVVAFLWLRLFAGQTSVAAPPADPIRLESSTRWAMALTSQRIDNFRREYNRTPTHLTELGYPSSELISYERISANRYRLSAPSPSGPIVFDSMRSRTDFLGRSLEILGAKAMVSR